MKQAMLARGERADGRASNAWVLATIGLAAAALALTFFALPHGLYADGYVRFTKLDALLRQGELSRERYSYIGPLFASPLWLFGDAREWWCARFNVLVLVAGCLAVWRSTRTRLAVEERASFVLLLVATGMMPNATRDFFGEPFSTVMAGTGLLLVAADRRWAGWSAIVLGTANTPAWTVGLAAAALWRAVRSRRFDGLLALGCAAAIVLLENTLVRGAPLNAGYQGDRGAITVMPFSGMPGFSYPLLFGIVSLLFSFGKGLFFFSPGLLLIGRARKAEPKAAAFLELSVAFLSGLVLVYSRWWSWYGGWTWGPRFLLLAVFPSSIALAIALHASSNWRQRVTAIAILGWTIWVGVSGAVFGLDGLDECTANGYALEHLCWYVPDFSPLFRPLVLRPASLAAWQAAWMVLAAVVLAILAVTALSTTTPEPDEPGEPASQPSP
jgi:hypothetical protein